MSEERESPYLARIVAIGGPGVAIDAKRLARYREIIYRRAGWLAASMAHRKDLGDAAWEMVDLEHEAIVWMLRALGIDNEHQRARHEKRASEKLVRKETGNGHGRLPGDRERG